MMNDKKINFYNENKKIFLNDTIYNSEELVSKNKKPYTKLSPIYGIKKGKKWFELKNSNISKAIQESYGIDKYELSIINNTRFNFFKHTVASGGALYPNNIYYIYNDKSIVKLYQINPIHGTYHLLSIQKIYNCKIKNGLVITNYFWRNWYKYNYFGYRLMYVDTGYMLSNLLINLTNNSIKNKLIISNELNKDILNILPLNINEESISAFIRIYSDFDPQKTEHVIPIYNKYLNWKQKDIPLYGNIEMSSLKENFYKCFNNKVKSTKKLIKNKEIRFSPGGGPLISSKNMNKLKFFNLINDLVELLGSIDGLNKNMHIFFYANKIDSLKSGVYELNTLDGSIKYLNDANIGKFDSILRNRNFNLFESQAFFFVGANNIFKENVSLISYFKFIQIKTGMISNFITLSGINNSILTHPLLGFDSKKSENLLNLKGINLLSFIILGEFKNPMLQIQYYFGE